MCRRYIPQGCLSLKWMYNHEQLNELIGPWIYSYLFEGFPDSKVHGANMGPIWGRQDPGGTHVGPMNFAIWVALCWMGQHVMDK